MKNLLICDTPFQLFNTLNLVWNNREHYSKSVLFIIDQFTGASKLSEKIADQQIFSDVVLCSPLPPVIEGNVFERYYELSKRSVNPVYVIKRQVGERYQCRKDEFSEIYACYYSSLCSAMIQLNKRCRFFMIEDGTGSYLGDIIRFNRSWRERLFCKIFKVGIEGKKPEKLYLNCPRFSKSTVCKVKGKLPDITEDFMALVNCVFDQIPFNSNKRIIWLSDVIRDIPGIRNAVGTVSEALKKYQEYVLLRKHPREYEVGIYGDFEINQGGIWELMISNLNMDNILLIGICSTAQLTPKMIFNKEPWLVFTYRIGEFSFPKEHFSRISNMIEALRNIYVHKEKIVVPETESELKDVLAFISHKIGIYDETEKII